MQPCTLIVYILHIEQPYVSTINSYNSVGGIRANEVCWSSAGLGRRGRGAGGPALYELIHIFNETEEPIWSHTAILKWLLKLTPKLGFAYLVQGRVSSFTSFLCFAPLPVASYWISTSVHAHTLLWLWSQDGRIREWSGPHCFGIMLQEQNISIYVRGYNNSP